jgi:hypothetical protein
VGPLVRWRAWQMLQRRVGREHGHTAAACGQRVQARVGDTEQRARGRGCGGVLGRGHGTASKGTDAVLGEEATHGEDS